MDRDVIDDEGIVDAPPPSVGFSGGLLGRRRSSMKDGRRRPAASTELVRKLLHPFEWQYMMKRKREVEVARNFGVGTIQIRLFMATLVGVTLSCLLYCPRFAQIGVCK